MGFALWLVKRNWGWVLPLIAVGFICYATGEVSAYQSYPSMRKSVYDTYDTAYHKPAKDMDFECPTTLAEDETATLKATITNDGPSAEFDIDLWLNFYRPAPPPAKCSQVVAIEHGESFSMECEISGKELRETARTDDNGNVVTTGVVIWAFSSEDDGNIHHFPNSYRGVCLIPDIPSENPYSKEWGLGYLAVGIGLLGGFAGWLRLRNRISAR